MKAFVTRHPPNVLFSIAYPLSWPDWFPLARAGAQVTPGGTVTHFPGLLGAAPSAFNVAAITEGKAGVQRLLHRMFLARSVGDDPGGLDE